jgi:predicted transcriptional regulator
MLNLSKLKTATYQNNNSRLTGLTAAAYILKWLSKGYTKDQIYAKFNGDIQLFSTWIDFLKVKKWIVQVKGEDDDSDLKVTKEGKTWLKRFESAHIKLN